MTATPIPLPGQGDWPRLARQSLGWGCWLMLAAAGAWPIAHVAKGVAAVPLIFAWLVALRLCGLLARRGQLGLADQQHAGF